MAVVGSVKIENIKPIEAVKRGYLTQAEFTSHDQWVKADILKRSNITFVYVNGGYVGVSTKGTPLFKILEKFHLMP